MSSSEDTSDSSNAMAASPQHYKDSPQNSPLQQVPQLVNLVNVMTCTDNTSIHPANNGNRPFLRIIEQPQNHFRFRYRSEMVGTHGCLLGRGDGSGKGKTHPTVELRNYAGRARVRCRLVQSDFDLDHPHQLEDEDNGEISVEVPDKNSYIIKFAGLGIIHTSKKDVPRLLFDKYMEKLKSQNIDFKHMDSRRIKTECENAARAIDLNIVRLKFTAHDLQTDMEICPPVFSNPIYNLKSAQTNDLKICRMSKMHGSVVGGENIFLLVEKVNKKNIEVHFVQICPDTGNELWRDKGRFTNCDVHHQFAIVCKTPAYQYQNITKDVDVYIELVRPSDGRSSERMHFKYKPNFIYTSKKRKYESYSSSLGSSSSGSLKSVELPATVAAVNNIQEYAPVVQMGHNPMNNIPYVQPATASTSGILADALYDTLSPAGPQATIASPVFAQPNVPTPIQFNSSEFSKIIDQNFMDGIESRQSQPADYATFLSSNTLSEYFKDFNLPEPEVPPSHINSMDFFRSMQNLQSDGAKNKVQKTEVRQSIVKKEDDDQIEGYSALYSEKDGPEVKKLLAELCTIIRNKKDYKKDDVRAKMQRLMELRLNNGDTFLHMTLCIKMLPSMDFIVKLIHSLKMTHLLNLVNFQSQTILHIAIVNNMPDYVPFLISKGCDPMIEDKEGNTAIHYAVIYQVGLSPLLNSIKSNGISCDLNAYNNEKQAPLHLAAQYGSAESISLLLLFGASYNVRDIDGRTPLHLAAYGDSLSVTEALLAHIPASEIDTIDGCGNTPLQVACGLQHLHSVDIARLLLKKGANPLKCEDSNESAWKLSLQNLELRSLIKEYIPADYIIDEDIKSEPEDDFESTEEDFPESGMNELPQYIHEVSALLDRSGRWQELATRLHQDALLNLYQNMPSPTAVLLSHVKDSGTDKFTSRSLAMILRDMGEIDAANAIYKYID